MDPAVVSKTTRFLDRAIRFFFYVLIFWLPYSSAVTEFSVIISVVFWVVKRDLVLLAVNLRPLTIQERFREILRAFRPVNTPVDVPIALFLGVCLASVSGSLFFAESLHGFITKTLEWFVVFYLAVEVFTRRRHFEIAGIVFGVTAAATVLDAFYQFYFTQKDIFNGMVIEAGSRATAGFKTGNGLGGYLTFVCVFLSAFILDRRQRPTVRIGMAGFLLSSLWALRLSSSRGAAWGVFAGMAFCAFHQMGLGTKFFLRRPKKLKYSLALLAISSILIFLMMTGGWLGHAGSLLWRGRVWNDTLVMVFERPFFGHGINTFMRIFREYNFDASHNPTYAHNCYLQLAAETGLFGLGFFFAIITGMFRASGPVARELRKNEDPLAPAAIGLLSGTLAFLVHCGVDTLLYSLQLSVYFWAMAGLLMAMTRVSGAVAHEQT